MKKAKQISQTDGFSLIEVVLSAALFVIIVAAIFGAVYAGLESTRLSGSRARAVYLAEQGLEVVRNIRDNDFDALADGTYGLTHNGSQWQLTASPDVTDIYTREIVITTLSSTRKQIESTVTWEQNLQRDGSVTLTTYLTDWVSQEPNPWEQPSERACVNLSGGQDAYKIDTQGSYAYIVTASSSESFVAINIADFENPFQAGALGLQNNPFNVDVSGDFAYLATKNNSAELQAIDVLIPTNPQVESSFNVSGNNTAYGVFVDGTRLYLTLSSGSNEFQVVDIANPSSPSLLGGLNLSATTYEVYVSGDYAYVATADDAAELQVINVSNPASPTLASTLNFSGNADALTITGHEDLVLIGRSDGTAYFVDVTNPNSPVEVSGYVAGGSVNDVDIDGTNLFAFLATSSPSEEFQVLDFSDVDNLDLIGSHDADDTLNGLSYHEGQNVVYVVGSSNIEDFCAIAPDPDTEPEPEPNNTGMLVYSDQSGVLDSVKYKILNPNGTWGPEQNVPDVPGDRPVRVVKLYSSPTRTEKILITKHSDDWWVFGGEQYFYAHVWDGTTWGNAIELAGYDNGINPHARNFDGDYNANGDFYVIYDDYTYTPKMRIWNGTNWSSALDTKSIGGYPVWISLKTRPGTNQMLAMVRDHFLQTNVFRWNGSSWDDPVQIADSSSGFTVENISLAWSHNTTSTAGMMFNEGLDTTPNIRTWVSGVISSDVENESVGSTVESLKIVDRPTANEFLACVKDYADDINCLESNFTPEWSTTGNGEVATRTDSGEQRSFDLAYENSGTLALVVYASGNNDTQRRIPKYRIYDPSIDFWTDEFDLPELGPSSSSALESVRLINDPNSDDILVVLGTTDNDISTILWNGESNAFSTTAELQLTEQATNGQFDIDYWYDFSWDYE